MDDEILTAEQVAKILKVHRFTVLKFIKQGKLKASKLGRVYRIRKSEVDRFLDDLMEKTEQKKEPVSKESKEPKTPKVPTKKTTKAPKPENPRGNDNDVDHYVLKIKDQHDI